MSDLQLALIVIGIVLVAAVFVYNKWQEARYRRQVENALKPGRADVLLRSTTPAETPTAGRVEPTWTDPEPAVAGAPPPQAAPPEARGCVSEAIDHIVELRCADPLRGQALIDAAVPVLARFGKRLRLEGRVERDWTALAPEQSYREMRFGLQLVDRTGALRAEDLDAFGDVAAQAAAAVGAAASEAGREAALDTAARLDRFCEGVDIQIAVHVASAGNAFAGTKVRALAEAGGLALEQDGRFHRRDEQGLEVFTLANEEAAPFTAQAMKTLSTSALVLELDVPRAPGGHAAFAQLRSFAEQLSAGLGGRLVDDNRAPLDSAGFEAIAAQLAPVYETMRAQGTPPGSPLALRLFS
jgi:FtsZ-interacting cell division protein ZipA